MMMKKTNKKAQFSIVLLVFMIFFLQGVTIFTLLTNNNKISTEISDAGIFDEVTAREREIDFYIYDILNSIENLENRVVIAKEFEERFEDYKYEGIWIVREFEQIEHQIEPENIVINEDYISIRFKIKIEQNVGQGFITSYLYEKEYKRYL